MSKKTVYIFILLKYFNDVNAIINKNYHMLS